MTRVQHVRRMPFRKKRGRITWEEQQEGSNRFNVVELDLHQGRAIRRHRRAKDEESPDVRVLLLLSLCAAVCYDRTGCPPLASALRSCTLMPCASYNNADDAGRIYCFVLSSRRHFGKGHLPLGQLRGMQQIQHLSRASMMSHATMVRSLFT